MTNKYIYKLRVESCIGAIIDAQKVINEKTELGSLLPRFEELKELVENLDMSLVKEEDVQRIEQATNSLLMELREIFEEAGIGPIYKKLN